MSNMLGHCYRERANQRGKLVARVHKIQERLLQDLAYVFTQADLEFLNGGPQ
jgi:hypothetical protein